METRGVDERNLSITVLHDPEQGVSRRLWQGRDDGQGLTKGSVEERRFADVGAADERNGAVSHVEAESCPVTSGLANEKVHFRRRTPS